MFQVKTHQYLKPKLRVGSIHSKVSYAKSEKVFHNANIPHAIKQKVQQTHDRKHRYLLNDILPATCATALPWNSSISSNPSKHRTIPHRHTCHKTKITYRTNQELLVHPLQMQLRERPNTATTENSTSDVWGTTQTRDYRIYQKLSAENAKQTKQQPWNISLACDSALFDELQSSIMHYCRNSTYNIKKMRKSTSAPALKTNAKTTDFTITNYENPFERQARSMKEYRTAKQKKRQTRINEIKKLRIEKKIANSYNSKILHILRKNRRCKSVSSLGKKHEEIKNEFEIKYQPKLLSEYLLNVSKNQNILINKRLIKLMMQKRNHVYSTRQLLRMQERRKYDLIRDYYHNGIFKQVWSCCLKSGRYSQGCEVRLTDTKRWQTLGF